jgi:hypothetical protein
MTAIEFARFAIYPNYTVTHYVDLSDYDDQPTGALYQMIEKIKKDEYANEERMVFVAPQGLTQTYADLPPDIILELQRQIKDFDIPHFFVIILSNIPAIADYLLYAKNTYNPQEQAAITHLLYV